MISLIMSASIYAKILASIAPRNLKLVTALRLSSRIRTNINSTCWLIFVVTDKCSLLMITQGVHSGWKRWKCWKSWKMSLFADYRWNSWKTIGFPPVLAGKLEYFGPDNN